MAGFLSSASTAAASRGHHHHTFAEEANEPPPPTLSRLPPDGHEFPPDYRDPAASTIYQVPQKTKIFKILISVIFENLQK